MSPVGRLSLACHRTNARERCRGIRTGIRDRPPQLLRLKVCRIKAMVLLAQSPMNRFAYVAGNKERSVCVTVPYITSMLPSNC